MLVVASTFAYEGRRQTERGHSTKMHVRLEFTNVRRRRTAAKVGKMREQACACRH